MRVPPSRLPAATAEFDIDQEELPTFVFIEVSGSTTLRIILAQDAIEMDKLATGLSYQQLNGGGVDTEKLGNQIRIVFRM